MFQKFESTQYPPTSGTVLVWDGECGFCRYWVTRWQHLTKGRIQFEIYQDVASQFPDIPLKEFKKASRLIEPDGKVYSGPDSAYRSYTYAGQRFPWHRWYVTYRWFQKLSDHAYNHIAKNRTFYFKVTKVLLGSDPKNLKPYWAVYLLIILGVFYVLSVFL
ncbi:MAG: thiol-disulfide oxidoreductase [Flavobacteriaceae bacterium]|nr:thiol-disulfide oxidoreductase [Flavobacteriaceae bacterium]